MYLPLICEIVVTLEPLRKYGNYGTHIVTLTIRIVVTIVTIRSTDQICDTFRGKVTDAITRQLNRVNSLRDLNDIPSGWVNCC
jgi:hypothetical protein